MDYFLGMTWATAGFAVGSVVIVTLLTHQSLAPVVEARIAARAVRRRLTRIASTAAAVGLLAFSAGVVIRSSAIVGGEGAFMATLVALEMALCVVVGSQLHLRGVIGGRNTCARAWLALVAEQEQLEDQVERLRPYLASGSSPPVELSATPKLVPKRPDDSEGQEGHKTGGKS